MKNYRHVPFLQPLRARAMLLVLQVAALIESPQIVVPAQVVVQTPFPTTHPFVTPRMLMDPSVSLDRQPSGAAERSCFLLQRGQHQSGLFLKKLSVQAL
jgi:hypothetical protein